MTSRIRFVAGALALALLVPMASATAAGQAAASPGPELMFTVGYVQSNLVKGKTTRADVIAAFGNPSHQKVRATDSGSTEVLYYQRGAQNQGSGGGLAKTTRGLGKIAGGLARMFGNNEAAYEASRASYQADNIADGMELMGGGGGGSNAAASNGPSTLTIDLQNGVVSGYSLE